MMWVVLALAVVNLVVSGIVFAGGRRIFPGLRRVDLDSRRLALIGALLSIFLMIESIPRVTHASVVVEFAMSVLAFAPLIAAIAVYLRRPKPRADVQHGSKATSPTEPGAVPPRQAG
jgi:hypothetical protein